MSGSISLVSESESEFSEVDSAVLNNTVSNSTKRRGRKRACDRGSKPEVHFSYGCHIKEDHKSAIYGISVNPYIKSGPCFFATAGSSKCTIYQCLPDGSLNMMHIYHSNDEQFFSCTWLYHTIKRRHLVAVAGEAGIIRIINPAEGDLYCNLVGHGNSVNELATHPMESHLLLSAGKDHTIRLWNVHQKVCVAIFGGFNGHRDEVLSIDFDLDGERFVSSGMDHTVRIWQLTGNGIDTALKKCGSKSFKPVTIHTADFSTNEIHTNYVDCVRFFGDLILSKAVDNPLSLWKPGDLLTLSFESHETNVAKICDFPLRNTTYWFIKFAIDSQFKWLAAGNQIGRISIWNLTFDIPSSNNADKMKPHFTLQHVKCNTTIRQLAFSPDSKILLAVCEDSTVWRWNIISS